ncbi:hypothetical protein [Neobacillus sp. 19]|uniref:hypothetical protein n=1 Tax=Neobacillus sp. 19 TaxID=3394458 RepID=UPI003BF768D6
MAKYKSQYLELGFYVKGDRKQFSGGHFVTENKAEIEVLEKLADVVRIDEPKAEETPKPKAPAKKSSGK